jgi:DNA mismatch endonuclease (patch repair protein)
MGRPMLAAPQPRGRSRALVGPSFFHMWRGAEGRAMLVAAHSRPSLVLSARASLYALRMLALVRSPPASSPAVRAVMQGNRAKDTGPEKALRSELHRRGLRFRKHVRVVPGLQFRPDIVFARARLVVECRGCFWHRCPLDGVTPRTNSEYWLSKLERNVERDRRNAAILTAEGWRLIVVWEHEEVSKAADRVQAALLSRSPRAL